MVEGAAMNKTNLQLNHKPIPGFTFGPYVRNVEGLDVSNYMFTGRLVFTTESIRV